MFNSTLEAALSSGDFLDKHADFIINAINTSVDKAILICKSRCPESQPVSEELLALIKEKRGLRRQFSQTHDPLVKTLINQLQKEIVAMAATINFANYYCSKGHTS